MNFLKNLWADTKAWFKNSWSIFIARLEVLVGILIGALAGIDWTALSSLDFSQGFKNHNTLIVSGLIILKGIISEIGRRSGTVENEKGTLVPTSILKDK